MPKFKALEVTVSGQAIEFQPAENGATSIWLLQGDTMDANSTVMYTRRPVNAKQTTRKSSLKVSTPLTTVCPDTCAVANRGAVMFSLDNVAGAQSTTAERERAYDLFVAVLNDAGIRDAFIHNGSFYS